MNENLISWHYHLQLFGHSITLALIVTGWKLIGYSGRLIFAGRWVVQFIESRRHKKPVIPGLFWHMSLVGNLMVLAYFTVGKNDSVGILGNLFTSIVSAYNLYLHETHRARKAKELTEG